jgi:FtsP/CotA-like multicopper oxidase with cupredoxin domain
MPPRCVSALCSFLALGFAAAPGWAVGVCDPGTVAAPASNDVVIRPALAEDVNPDPSVLEVFLTAREAVIDLGTGNNTAVFTYNGVLPGPMLEANVGDTLIVHLCNDLPVDTTIHWHGLETPANMDGSHIAQGAVPPGGTFRYEFPLLVAGTFWYHPHIQTNVQVEKGLYGAIVVHDPAEIPLPTPEHVFVLDDILLDEDGQVVEPYVGTREDVALEQLNGREGNTMLFNGQVWPDLTMERGIPHRVRMINVANARFMRTSFPDHPMWRIGGDQGLIEEAIRVEPAVAVIPGKHPSDPDPKTGITLTPGERADYVFVPQGEVIKLEWHDTQRGRHSVEFLKNGDVILGHNVPDGDQQILTFARAFLFGNGSETEWDPPSPLTDLTAIDTTGAPGLPLVAGHTVPDWDTGEVTFFIQAPGLPFDVLTPDDVHDVLGNHTYIWEVKNLTGSHHNFHTHGFGFQHIETEFVDLDFPNDPERNYIEPATHLENKDVFLMKRRPGTVPLRSWSITRLAVNFRDTGREGQINAAGKVPTETESGGWLAHCHILEHSTRGMMTFFQIKDIFLDGFESGDTSAWSATVP